MIKGVAFDFDCTMYERTQVWNQLAPGFIKRFHDYLEPSLSDESVLRLLQEGDSEGIACDDDWQGIFGRYIKKGLFAQAPTYEDFFAFIHAEFPGAIVLQPDAMDCLNELKKMGMKLGIYTNGLSGYAQLKITSTGIDKLMDFILCSGDIGIEKPDKRGFAMLAEGLDLPLEELVFVGDHPHIDVNGARNAGMTGVWIKALVDWPEQLPRPEYTIDTLSGIIAVVNKINSES